MSLLLVFSKSLADLAIWEPKTFEALTMIARDRALCDGMWGVDEKNADNRVYYHTDEIKADKEKVSKLTPANYSAYYYDFKEFNYK